MGVWRCVVWPSDSSLRPTHVCMYSWTQGGELPSLVPSITTPVNYSHLNNSPLKTTLHSHTHTHTHTHTHPHTHTHTHTNTHTTPPHNSITPHTHHSLAHSQLTHSHTPNTHTHRTHTFQRACGPTVPQFSTRRRFECHKVP